MTRNTMTPEHERQLIDAIAAHFGKEGFDVTSIIGAAEHGGTEALLSANALIGQVFRLQGSGGGTLTFPTVRGQFPRLAHVMQHAADVAPRFKLDADGQPGTSAQRPFWRLPSHASPHGTQWNPAVTRVLRQAHDPTSLTSARNGRYAPLENGQEMPVYQAVTVLRPTCP
jgi:hypothetical protein